MRRPGRPWAAVQSCRPGVERISRIEGAASVMVIDAASLTTAAATHTTAGGASSTTRAEGTRAGGTRTAAGGALTAAGADLGAATTATTTLPSDSPGGIAAVAWPGP